MKQSDPASTPTHKKKKGKGKLSKGSVVKHKEMSGVYCKTQKKKKKANAYASCHCQSRCLLVVLLLPTPVPPATAKLCSAVVQWPVAGGIFSHHQSSNPSIQPTPPPDTELGAFMWISLSCISLIRLGNRADLGTVVVQLILR